MASLYDRISKGTISVDEITASMERSTSAGGKYFQSMEKQSQTLSGQFSTLKDNAQQMLGELASSTSTAISGTFLPMVNQGLSDMMDAFQTNGAEGMAQVGGELVANLATALVQQAPQLVSMAVTLLTALITGLQTNATQIAESAITIVTTLATGVLGMLPTIISLGLQLIIALVTGLAQEAPTLITAIIDAVIEMANALTEPTTLSNLVTAALQLILALVDGLLDALPRLIQFAPVIIQNVVMALIQSLPQIINAGIQLIGALIKGIESVVTNVVGVVFNLVGAIIGVFKDTDWSELGKNIIEGIKEGINKLKDSVVNTVGNVAEEVANRFKDFLGIHSPSRLFMQFGLYTDEGFAIGVDKGAKDIYKSFENLEIPANFQTTLPSTADLKTTATQTVTYAGGAQDGLGDYIISTATAQMQYIANALEKGIGNMRMVADGRETARFMTNLGFARA